MFAQIKVEVLHVTGEEWEPSCVVCDFELALHQAIVEELLALVLACYFHFTQALFRHVCTNGLEMAYRENGEVTKVIKLILSIGYLPVEEVEDSFENLVNHRRTQEAICNHPGLGNFLDYVRATYIEGDNFPLPIWNIHEQPMLRLTTPHGIIPLLLLIPGYGRWLPPPLPGYFPYLACSRHHYRSPLPLRLPHAAWRACVASWFVPPFNRNVCPHPKSTMAI